MFKYPIYENAEESWERLTKIYILTDKLAGPDYIVPISLHDISQAWQDVAVFLTNAIEQLNGIDYMYEAIYHIRYRAFTENVNESDELKLVLLIEEELCRCGYAFYVWSNMSEFQSRYDELLFPRKNSRGWRDFCPWYMEMYLAGNMANRIMLKDIRPIDWGGRLDCDRATYPYDPDYMRYRVTVFEQAMEILLPESSGWYEEWMDIDYITERIKERYNMDLRSDSKGFDDLIELAVEKKIPKACACNLYSLNNITLDVLEVLWGEKTPNMMAKCFLNIYQRYKAAKKAGTMRSKYSSQAVQRSTMYCWIAQHIDALGPKSRGLIRAAMFRIEMNI